MSPDPAWHVDVPTTLLAWAPVPRRVRYARVGHAGPFELPRTVLEETWGEPQTGPDGVRFRRVTRDVTGAPRIVEDACVRYGPGGLEDIGTYDGDGTLRTWDPPQRVLPADPTPGQAWTATHQRGEMASTREVCIAACTDHPDCLVSIIETRRDDGAMVLRIHYTRGEGFATYEALIQSPGRPSIKTWTEALTVETRPA